MKLESRKAMAAPVPHSVGAEQVMAWQDVTPQRGLSAHEAACRFARAGPNAMPAPHRRGSLVRFLLQFHNVLIYVLLLAGMVTALLGHWIDSSVIFGVVVINAVIGYVQEGKAERALDAIRTMLSPTAHVLRDGRRSEIAAERLVPGDIVFLASGDKVPADLRLVEVRSLRVEEAALTGESLAVDKTVVPVVEATSLGDRRCMAYSGTLVTYGQGAGVVVATGAQTEIGRIGRMIDAVSTLATPLIVQLGVFARWLTWSILLVAAAMFAFGTLVRGYTAAEMFLAAVGLAVAVIPEGLPAIMTITLAIGVQRMASRNAIIRRLPAVEALGAVTVICSDKTGTLTRNEMAAQCVITADGTVGVSGVGYSPHGGFSLGGRALEPAGWPVLEEVGRAAVLCNDADIARDGDAWRADGDPTEAALVALAGKAGVDAARERSTAPRIDVIPFAPENRFMSTLHGHPDGRAVIYLKGAPERVLALCKDARGGSGERLFDPKFWDAAMAEAASQGMRLLAVAARLSDASHEALTLSDIEAGGFTLLAVIGLADPPRDEAIRAVANCRSAGIRVKMITGDHALTARAIGEQLGLSDQVSVMTGSEIERLDDQTLAEAAGRTDIFARTSPEHKLRLVQALQASGEVVVMTGDGVNDAPALKRANIGVAMGGKGTEAAKEAAEMVLADDNFASVAAAVEEGRTVYDNLRKAIVFILPTNVGEGGMMLVAVLIGLTLPITAAQILWVNMITAVTLALAIAFEPAEPNIMERRPRDPHEPLLNGMLAWRICFVGTLLVAGAMGLFLWALARGADLETSRTIAVNALVVGEAVYLFNIRRFATSALNIEALFGGRHVMLAVALLTAAQVLFTYAPPMQAVFGSAALDWQSWSAIMVFGCSLFLLVELEKRVMAGWHVRRRGY